MTSRFDDGLPKRDAGGAPHRPEGRRPEIDAATFQRCIERDAEAEKAFVKMYDQRIRAWLGTKVRRGASEDVDDLAQDVFLKVFQGIADFRPPWKGGEAQVSTWLFKIAWNVSIDRHRRHKREIDTVDLRAAERVPSSASPQRDRERTERQEAIEKAMEALSDDQRSALFLFETQGKTCKEIAEIQGTNENTVKKRLYNARSKLRELLKGLTHEEERKNDE
jgi:RNA polymerase sigma-70 factor (ECF subfamily)